MIPLTIHMVGDGAFLDRTFSNPDKIADVSDVAFLENGTVSGNGTVAVVLRTADGQEFVGQTTWRLLFNAVSAFEARYGRPAP